MSEASRSRVTITLGRTGQVVKRADSSFTDSHPVAGSKRSIRERLGNVDSPAEFNSKRQRRDGRAADSYDDIRLSKDDLRYKLMQKNILKQGQNSRQNGGDLRNILSRPAQFSESNLATRDRRPEPKDTRVRFSEPVDGKQHYRETRDGGHLLPASRYSSQQIPEFRLDHAVDSREKQILEAREGRRSILEEKGVRHLMHEQRPSNAVTRPSNAESGINAYSPWTLDRLRRRSPDDTLAASRGVAPPKRDEIPQRRFAVGTYDDVRTSTYMSKDAFELSRPMSSANLGKMAPSIGQIKTMAPVPSSLPLSGSLPQRSTYVVNDHVTVDSFLRSLGLDKFAVLFKAEEVDMYSLKRMTEIDLKELGIPMGPRKKILLALQPRLKQPA